jgi:hypothetical protein
MIWIITQKALPVLLSRYPRVLSMSATTMILSVESHEDAGGAASDLHVSLTIAKLSLCLDSL